MTGRQSTWRTGFVEGLRNIVAAPFLFGALSMAVALLVGGAITADLAVINGIVANERAFLDAGGDLLRASVRDWGAIDAARCAAVEHVDGVSAASAMSARQVRLAGRPDHAQTVLQASAGLETIVGAPLLGEGQAIASQVVAERWEWRAGTLIALLPDAVLGAQTGGASWTPPEGVLTLAATPDTSRLGDQASTAIIVAGAAVGDADECIVQAEPQALDSIEAALPAMLGEGAIGTVDVQRQVFTGAFGPDPAGEFAARPTRMVGIAAGIIVGVLLAFITWTRRQRAALYATLGMTYTSGVILRASEAIYPALLGIAWGALWAALAGTGFGLAPHVSAVTAALHALAAAATAIAVIAIVSLWRPPTLQALKDR
jgi:hypothetical protein